MKVDTQKLSDLLSREMNRSIVSLEPIDVSCAWPVFKTSFAVGEPAFVKVTERASAERTLDFLARVKDCAFLPHPLIDCSLPFGENAVLCLSFLSSTRVNAEEMSDAQYESFRTNYLKLESCLSSFPREAVMPNDEDDPDVQKGVLAAYIRRFPFLKPCLKSLLACACSYAGRTLSVIHSDFQPANYGFQGDQFAAVYDTDNLSLGLPCEDAAYAFTERARRAELTPAARQRLTALFLRLVADCPWPREDWLFAVNHARLRIASRRILRHPHSPFVAFDVAHRDRPLRVLARALEACHA